MSRIIEQTRLLCRQHIASREQLLVYQQKLEIDVQRISSDRKVIYNKLRRCRQPEQIEAYREQIAVHSRQLAQLRKEVRLCAGILARSETIKDKLQHREETFGKEVEAHERKRGGRSGRQHEPARH
ncbi:hypothetical protein [Cohnella rhizosphaerae]|uniref:Uncharacterized protein n=1 Tax=Cohnella rhizosphaerae TaxID=1457232 RepID=A0A9X4KT13_9BACL|nr:hypothetical protein [Cohnella rhizosphaerae]MDG0810320.1 hypothetical protein [Cohnella rhizosphaerae]